MDRPEASYLMKLAIKRGILVRRKDGLLQVSNEFFQYAEKFLDVPRKSKDARELLGMAVAYGVLQMVDPSIPEYEKLGMIGLIDALCAKDVT